LGGTEVHYLTKDSFKGLLRSNPFIDKLHVLTSSLSQTLKELQAENFDYVIDLHNNLRTLILKTGLGVKSSSFNKLNFKKWLFVQFKIRIMPEVHIVDRYLKAAAFLGVENDGKGLDYFFEKEHTLSKLIPEGFENYTGLVVGAAHATKRLPTYKLIEICKLSPAPVVLLGGKDDAERGEEISRAAGEKVYNACGKLTLDQSAFLVREAKKIVTHDTGLMHIASAFNKQIVSVWGNTVPELGMYPYQVSDLQIMEVKGLKCRPCSKIGYKKCPLGHFKCMNEQDINLIFKDSN
jgi:ADP-heptose:LPS heptosyltransferase